MRQRWISVLFSIAWMVLASVLPAHAGWPGSSQHNDDKKEDKKEDKKAEKDPKKVDQALANQCVGKSAWLAYFRDPDGTLAPVRDTRNSDHDEDWQGLHFTDYEGPRIRLGVLSVVNRTAETENGDSDGTQHLAVPAAGIQEMLTVALYNTKRFDVIEQKRIGEIKREQTRTDIKGLPELQPTDTDAVKHGAPSKGTHIPTAKPSSSTITNVGTVLGVQYLVYGTINEWTPDRVSRSTGGASASGLLSHLPGGNLVGAIGVPKFSKNEAEVAITVTLADVATGQVLYTTTQRARVGASHVDLGGGESSEKTPVTYAVAASTNKAAFEVARFLKNHKWNGTIVAMNAADIYVNSGKQSGMEAGIKLNVKKVIMTVVDHESHTILGEDTDTLCSIKINKVAPNFSVARVALQDCPGINVGYRVETDQLKAQEPIPDCVAAETNPAR